MAKKYLSLDRLTEYDALLKAQMSESDASTLESAKGYADEKLAGLTGGTTTVAKAEEATHATSADTATKATEATHAETATTATNANHATSADSATNAVNATNATKATQDANGKVITETYETKADASAKLTEAKGYTDSKLANLTSGTTTVAKATEATKATQDANGKVIVDTYETKADAAAKLTEAKGYADTAASNAATAVKNELLNGAGEAFDTLKELGDLINENQDAIGSLETIATGKADKEHEHTVSDITDYVAPVQSDWNQNDETALDHVKNRPFYINSVEEVTVLEETVVEQAPQKNTSYYLSYIELVDGKTYTININGEAYESIAQYNEDLEDYRLSAGPIKLVSVESEDESYLYLYEAGTYTVSITTDNGAKTVLSERVLELEDEPYGYKYLSYIELVEGKTYTININGEAYESIAQYDADYNEYYMISDLFSFGSYPEDDESCFRYYGYDTCTVSITTKIEDIVKLDKKYLPDSVVATPDWDQNDPSGAGYIENRPFYRELNNDYLLSDFVFDGDYHYGVYSTVCPKPLIDGESYTVYFDGETYENVPYYYTYNGAVLGSEDEYPFVIYVWDESYGYDEIYFYAETEGQHELTIYGPCAEYIQLSEKYIPLSVASDWNEQNSEKVSYIHNKPFSSKTIDMVVFDGEVDFSTGYNGSGNAYTSFTLGIPSQIENTLEKFVGLRDRVYFNVELNGVEYKNLTCKSYYHYDEDCIYYVGATSEYADGKTTIHFTEEHPFAIELSSYESIVLCVPVDFVQDNFDVKVTVHGITVDKIDGMYLRNADWNELTDTKASFIENKPFGEYLDYTLVPIIERKSIPGDRGQTSYPGVWELWLKIPDGVDAPLSPGLKYSVIVNNVRYDNLECFISKNDLFEKEETPTIGSPKHEIWNIESEYPFTIEDGGKGYLSIWVNLNRMQDPSFTNFSLYEYVAETKVKTIDPKYLPFDISDPYSIVIYPETTHTAEDVSYGYEFRLSDQIGIYNENVGETYIVRYDGIEYECKCYSPNGYKHLGNPHLLYTLNDHISDIPDEIKNNNEPFVIVCDVYNVLCTELGQHTIEIIKPIAGEIIAPVSTKAIYDSEGNMIVSTYETKSDAYDKLSEAKEYTDSKVSAYETKSDASAKLTEAKGYTDTEIGKLTSGTTTVSKATTASNAEKLGGQLPSYYAAASAIPTGALANKSVVSESDLDSALAEKVNAASEGNHSHSNKTVLDGITAAKVSAWDSAEANAKAHAETVATNAANAVKNDLLNGAGDAYDTLKELGDLIDENEDAIKALQQVASGKADAEHTHVISDVVNLQDSLDAKANQADLTGHTGDTTVHITSDERTKWNAVTTKANQSDLTSHTGNATAHITADERTKWNTAHDTANAAKSASETNTASINAHTASINAHTTAIGNLQTAITEFEEVTTAEILALFA